MAYQTIIPTAQNIPTQLMNWLQTSQAVLQTTPQLPKPAISRRKFSHEEDEKLKSFVDTYGENDWRNIASRMENRNARQCRERWKHYLSPNVSTGPWTNAEDTLLFEKYSEFGPQWARIAKFFTNRTDINVKNRWISLNGKSRKQVKLEQERSNAQQPVQSLETPQPIPTQPEQEHLQQQEQSQQQSGQ
ncbi:Myb-like DNA-binding domain containing protein [Histomonas meleagridis]|uniref:Myb-like DNA-binding domain containing protein n=1 Tax=Histomonas meleagridis TaxID=135588 RepID=UPI003559D204|nr:Myb-like DNA-binding domain containing protein [Histomonas meleagridis]KAH0798460.1 Myb-like DNA-binding domain containing protein [Histomonas meleagridis]